MIQTDAEVIDKPSLSGEFKLQTKFQWITFREVVTKPGRVTRVFECRTNEGNDFLGCIRWYSPWRRYCFMPASSVLVFEQTCLRDIATFLDALTEERRLFGKNVVDKKPKG